ncbi:MAG: YdcF family protein [Chitinophagaceae bacterium]|nr:MAG: YdcF family protein [Chitinophagaceae bacterium]
MFLIGKLLLLLLKPLTWIITLFIIGLLAKTPVRKKRILLVTFFLLFFFTNPLLFRSIIRSYEIKPVTLAPVDNFSAGILLGGFVSYNVKEEKAYFNTAVDRFVETALLYKQGHIQRIIITAGNGYVIEHDFQEANFAKDHLVALGVPGEHIYTDPYSRNTYENAVNTRKIMDSLQISGTSLLISSALHLPRAKMLFVKQGINVRLFPCDFMAPNVANNFWEDYLLPSAKVLSGWDVLLKEWAGLAIYKIQGRI